MTAVQALGVFIGIPLVFAAIVAALVYSKAWTRAGRSDADYAASPFVFASAPAMPDPSRLPGTLSAPVVGGGVSARW